jgi:hypothetical protein
MSYEIELIKKPYRNEQEYIKSSLLDSPPAGYEDTPFKVGDIVSYTNDYGVEFKGMKVIGFSNDEGMIRNKAFIHTSGGAYWFPNKPSSFRLMARLDDMDTAKGYQDKLDMLTHAFSDGNPYLIDSFLSEGYFFDESLDLLEGVELDEFDAELIAKKIKDNIINVAPDDRVESLLNRLDDVLLNNARDDEPLFSMR